VPILSWKKILIYVPIIIWDSPSDLIVAKMPSKNMALECLQLDLLLTQDIQRFGGDDIQIFRYGNTILYSSCFDANGGF
jgi:hypothetical protein